MKRKIVRHGPSSLTISIPMKWAKQKNLKAGDEINVEENEGDLKISTSVKPKKSTINIDVSDAGVMTNRIIAATYKAGYDFVNITYKTSGELQIIQDTVYRSCHTYEIMNIENNVVRVKTISDLDPAEFNGILKKMAQVFTNSADETLQALKTDDSDKLSNIIVIDRMIDRHADFCRRVLNSGNSFENQRTGPLYVLVEQTEIAADVLKRICNTSIKKGKPEESVIKLFSKVNDMIRLFYTSLFNFNMDNMVKLGKLEVQIRQEVESIKTKDTAVLIHVYTLFETVFEMKSALMTMRIGKK